MPIIPITDKWRIESDTHAWQVSRRKQTPRTRASGRVEAWKGLSWHPTLSSALESLSARLLRASDATDIDSLLQDAERIAQIIHQAAKVSNDLNLSRRP